MSFLKKFKKYLPTVWYLKNFKNSPIIVLEFCPWNSLALFSTHRWFIHGEKRAEIWITARHWNKRLKKQTLCDLRSQIASLSPSPLLTLKRGLRIVKIGTYLNKRLKKQTFLLFKGKNYLTLSHAHCGLFTMRES